MQICRQKKKGNSDLAGARADIGVNVGFYPADVKIFSRIELLFRFREQRHWFFNSRADSDRLRLCKVTVTQLGEVFADAEC